jgi:hypothetical protein
MAPNLVITTEDIVRENLSRLIGHSLDDLSTVSEMLRHELSARGISSRRTVCDQVEAQLAAFATCTREGIRKTLDELERSGDVSSAPGGRIAPAPLRLVDLDGRRFAVFCGLPSSELRRGFPFADIASEQTQRWLSFPESAGSVFNDTVAAMGGQVISTARWAGMDRVQACGEEWMEDLASRLEQESSRPDSWDQESLDEWNVYVPDAAVPTQRKRWSRLSKQANGHLWRARHRLGWWVYAWTEGDCPTSCISLKLRQDDAMRTTFSLDSTSDAPLTFQFSKGNEVELLVDAFLPLAEYRFLNVSGRQSRDENGAYRYRFGVDAWERVLSSLCERLHVKLKEANS